MARVFNPLLEEGFDMTADAGTGAVDSVNTKTGVVVINPDDLDDSATTNKFTTAGDISKLSGIEAGADVNVVNSVNTKTGAVVIDPDDLDDTSTTNKFTTAGDISKLSGIEAGADVNVVVSVNTKTDAVVIDPDDLDDTSTTNKFVNGGTIGLLTDVDTTGAAPDYVLKYNGATWESGMGSSVAGSTGIQFYMDDTDILPADTENTYPVKTLSQTPTGGSEDVDVISCDTDTVAYGTYLYETAISGTTIDAGVWVFNTYASVTSILAGRVSSILRNIYIVEAGTTITVTGTGTSRTATADTGTPFVSGMANADQTLSGYVQTPKGLYQITGYTSTSVVTVLVPTDYANESAVAYFIHKYQFGSNTGTITALTTSYTLYSTKYVSSEISIDPTDSISERIFGISNNATDVNFVHNGTENYSHFETPLMVRHNQMPGLQGGTTDEKYHLTSAQHAYSTVLTEGNVLVGNGPSVPTATPFTSPNVKDLVATVSPTTGAVTISAVNAEQLLTMTGAVTFSVSNFVNTYRMYVNLEVTNPSTYTMTFPSGFVWVDGTEPTWTDDTWIIAFSSRDGGTNGFMAASGPF